jgi:hypothetical protein
MKMERTLSPRRLLRSARMRANLSAVKNELDLSESRKSPVLPQSLKILDIKQQQSIFEEFKYEQKFTEEWVQNVDLEEVPLQEETPSRSLRQSQIGPFESGLNEASLSFNQPLTSAAETVLEPSPSHL